MNAIRSAHLRRVLAAYRQRLEARFGTRLRDVRLFGSWARGEATEDSDVDVAVIVDGLTREEWSEVIAMAVDVEGTEGTCLSPFAVFAEHFRELVDSRRRIARDILAEGIPT
jgi:predicted nucleotidyltransferase